MEKFLFGQPSLLDVDDVEQHLTIIHLAIEPDRATIEDGVITSNPIAQSHLRQVDTETFKRKIWEYRCIYPRHG